MSTNLDHELKEWAKRRQPGQDLLDGLASRVVTEAARHRYQGRESGHTVRGGVWFKLGYAMAGAAGAVLVCALWFGLLKTSVPAGNGGDLARLTSPTEAQMDAARKLFAETTRLFPQQLRWIAQSNGEIGLGVESDPNRKGSTEPALFVRLVMVKRSVGETRWTQAWTTDVVLRGEELVEVEPRRKMNDKLALWVYPLDNGKVAVNTAVVMVHPLPMNKRTDVVVGMGEPSEIASSRQGNEEFKLLQIVERLDAAKGRKS